MTSTVYLYVGASASGKTSYAHDVVDDYPTGDFVIAERDAIRRMMGFPPMGDKDQERTVTEIHNGIISNAVADGKSVVVSNTNINKQFRKHLIRYCHNHGADVRLVIFDIPLDVLLERTKNRPANEQVPVDVIKKQHDQLQSQLSNGSLDVTYFPAPEFEPYIHQDNEDIGEAVVVDIDGTVADSVGIRSPYDYSRVSLDKPRQDVISIVQALASSYDIIFVSGRDGACRAETAAWLDEHVDVPYQLFMRPAGNVEPDYIIKNRIVDEEIIPSWDIVAWVDDRLNVIRHVRARGINVLDVAGGKF